MKFHRLISAVALLLFVTCVVGIARAQTAPGTRSTPCNAATPNNAICLGFTYDGKALTGETLNGITYRVEQRTGSAGTFATIAPALTAKQLYVTGLAVGSYQWRVFVNCTDTGCIESDGSTPGSGTSSAPVLKPTTPVIIIAATIRADGPPTYRIIQSVTLGPNEVAFVAPAAMRPLFANR